MFRLKRISINLFSEEHAYASACLCFSIFESYWVHSFLFCLFFIIYSSLFLFWQDKEEEIKKTTEVVMPSNKYSSAIMAESDKMTATVRWKKSVGRAVRICHDLPTLYSLFLLFFFWGTQKVKFLRNRVAFLYPITMNGDWSFQNHYKSIIITEVHMTCALVSWHNADKFIAFFLYIVQS